MVIIDHDHIADTDPEFIQQIRRKPQVMDVYFLAGADDFILHVAPPTAKATQEIKIQTSNGNKIVKGWGLPQG